VWCAASFAVCCASCGVPTPSSWKEGVAASKTGRTKGAWGVGIGNWPGCYLGGIDERHAGHCCGRLQVQLLVRVSQADIASAPAVRFADLALADAARELVSARHRAYACLPANTGAERAETATEVLPSWCRLSDGAMAVAVMMTE
jgi:hypothetical protein